MYSAPFTMRGVRTIKTMQTERPRLHPTRQPPHGFTMVELIVILMVGGILAAYALPKLGAVLSVQDNAWREEVVSALRYAQKGAVARRRLTCVTITTTTIAITAAAANPATACTTAMKGPDGSDTFATAGSADAATAVAPAGVIYFQADGRVTTDGAGTTAATRTVSMSGASDVVVYGETGHVE